jgi:hypothetical protein
VAPRRGPCRPAGHADLRVGRPGQPAGCPARPAPPVGLSVRRHREAIPRREGRRSRPRARTAAWAQPWCCPMPMPKP